jgi:DNA-binding MarR family transcriptional regulator
VSRGSSEHPLNRPASPLDLEEMLHSRARFAVLAYLSTAGSADFTELRDRTELTDGNLSTHLRKLEEGGYVLIEKSFVGRRPRTLVRLTKEGRSAFQTYIDTLEAVLREMRRTALQVPGR